MGQVALIWCDLVVPMNRPRTHANLDAIPYSKRGDSLTTNKPRHVVDGLPGAGVAFTLVRGLLRLLVVAFTIVSLMIVAAVGVAASSGKEGSAKNVKNSVAALLSGHVQVGTLSIGAHEDHARQPQGNGCHPPKKVHKHGTPGHRHHPCGDDEDDDSG